MGESVHPAVGEEGDKHEKSYETDETQKQQSLQKLARFEEQVEKRKGQEGSASRDSVAHTTMLNGGKMSDERWEGDPEAEKDNIVQEELYVHGKTCIVDDRIVICGSANINDRVGAQYLISPRRLSPRLESNLILTVISLLSSSPSWVPTTVSLPL